MKKGEIFDLAALSVRAFDDAKGLINALRRNTIVWSWGAEKWCMCGDGKSGREVKAIRFKSNGFLHKGLVYITVNGLDLFDIYLTTLNGKIKSVTNDIYLEDLINTIDRLVETEV